GEPDGVFADEPTQLGTVVPAAVVVQADFGVPLAAGELEAVACRGGGLQDDVAEAVVLDVIDEDTRRIHDVADGAERVRQVPGGPLAGAVAGEDFVDRIAEQVAGQNASSRIEVGPGV